MSQNGLYNDGVLCKFVQKFSIRHFRCYKFAYAIGLGNTVVFVVKNVLSMLNRL